MCLWHCVTLLHRITLDSGPITVVDMMSVTNSVTLSTLYFVTFQTLLVTLFQKKQVVSNLATFLELGDKSMF